MGEQSKNKRMGFLILIPIVVIATCNILMRSGMEKEDKAILSNPMPGDYYLFHRPGGGYSMPFKVRKVLQDKLVFWVPKYELGVMSGDREKLQSYIEKMEKQGLYDSLEMEIPRQTLDSMTNESISKKQYEIAEGFTLNFVDCYKGLGHKNQH